MGASVKKHEAISADILVRQERFRDLKAMSSLLQQERYWREQEIRDRENAIMEWLGQLLELLGVQKDNLEREIDTLSVTIMALQQELDTSKPGSYLLKVQEKLQKFQLQESQVHNNILHQDHYFKKVHLAGECNGLVYQESVPSKARLFLTILTFMKAKER